MAQIRPFEINEKISTVKKKKDEDVFCIKDLIMKARKQPPEFPTVKLRLVHNTTFEAGDRISITPNYFGIEMSDNYNRNIWYDEDEKCFVTEVAIGRRSFDGKDVTLWKDEPFGKIFLLKK